MSMCCNSSAYLKMEKDKDGCDIEVGYGNNTEIALL